MQQATLTSHLKEQCHDVLIHFSDYFEIEGNLKVIVI